MQKFILTLCALFALVAVGVAQDIEVKGVVVAQEDGEPVMGASVRVVGSETLGRTTDLDGKFAITVPTGAVLRVSYIGMKTVDVKARPTLRIVMESVLQDLDEVMVVAFGTAKKSAFTGSAAVVKAEEIGKMQVVNPMDALAGKAAGVQINNISGQPGQSSPAVLIRGISSITAGTQPLIVLDGSPFDGDMSTLSNQDIESMTVLKDAASAALYGARGANGVILITTKSGSRGADREGSVTFDAKWGSNSRAIPAYNTINSPAKYYEMWYAGLHSYAANQLHYSDDEACRWANQNLTAANGYGLGYNVYNVPQGEYLIGSNGRLNPAATLGRVYEHNGRTFMLLPDDWDDAIYGTGLRQEYTLSANGGGEKSAFYVSVNYMNNEGITAGSAYERLTGRLKADYQVKPWLKMGGNVSYVHYTSDYLQSDGSTGDTGNTFSFTQLAPIYPIYVRDGQGNIIFDTVSGIDSYDYGDGTINGQVRPTLQQANPLSSNQLDVNHGEGNAVSATGMLEVRLPMGFKITSTNSVNNDEGRFNSTMNPYFGQYTSLGGYASVQNIRTWSYNIQQLAGWLYDFGDHNIDVMVGHEYYRSHYYTSNGAKQNQYDPGNPELAGAITTFSAGSYTTDYNVEGWLARAQYNYGMKYFASASFRRDGSSRFHPDHRWGNFYSLGGAWRMAQEPWLKDVKWIDELKLKVSFGQQGNDNIGSYRYTNHYTVGSNAGSVALMPSVQAGNEYISWETGTNFNTGVEFSLWRGRLTGGIEYFTRKTSDMLYNIPMAPSWGHTHKYYNVGDMRNSGVEIELAGDVLRIRDLTWSLRANLTAYKNKLLSMPAECRTMTVDGVEGYVNGNYFYGVGQSVSTFYMPRYAGVDPGTGEALYYKDVTDATGRVTGEIATADYTDATYHLCGDALPRAYGGFGTSLSWKGLTVGIDFSYQIGGLVYDYTYAAQMGFGRGYAFHADLLDAWTPANPYSNVPRLQFNDQYTAAVSDRFLTSASCLCLQNVNIGYSLPQKWVQKARLQQVRLYASGDNLWLWSKRQGLDPRQSAMGGSAENYAPIRSVSGGVTVTF